MPPLSKVTVLILDDNPLVLKLGRALLEREGCTVLTASSWIEFNHVLAGNTPDIIVLDVNLPSIKGNRLSEVLKSQSNKKDIPIVLISDLPEKSLEEMFPSSGANAWMRKPLTRDKMVDMITRYVSVEGFFSLSPRADAGISGYTATAGAKHDSHSCTERSRVFARDKLEKTDRDHFLLSRSPCSFFWSGSNDVGEFSLR